MLCVEQTSAVAQAAAHIPTQRGDLLLDTAARYAEERHWDVVPGTWLEMVDGYEHCSCGAGDCPAPGAHPAGEGWAARATGSAAAARLLWSEQPKASILLPTGRAFDVVDVAESAGFLALARMERLAVPLGPVALTPDRRMLFFVLPGSAAKIPERVRQLGGTPAPPALTARGEGGYVAAPPTRFGSRGHAQWVRRPGLANRWLPDAEELFHPLAYACGRDAAAARGR
ncbi:bifunctional DNA primase/polymerase [Streptomyces sp. GC420]|uniref:bifunctional DNA primase/polymerase n=1 Tax=Streptomyces sp. GC420 TaxID=2697568 RepID=UPI001414D23E|nr:bifunctional DNA primase/polymerase [Streptomyces sp. GC420]NBM18881.1 DNA primase [Streptomyces sp. GC420]